MTEGGQQQQGQQQPQGGGQQQPLGSEQRLGRALQGIRHVQNWMELNYPQHGQAIQVLREAGDLVWAEISDASAASEIGGGSGPGLPGTDAKRDW